MFLLILSYFTTNGYEIEGQKRCCVVNPSTNEINEEFCGRIRAKNDENAEWCDRRNGHQKDQYWMYEDMFYNHQHIDKRLYCAWFGENIERQIQDGQEHLVHDICGETWQWKHSASVFQGSSLPPFGQCSGGNFVSNRNHRWHHIYGGHGHELKAGKNGTKLFGAQKVDKDANPWNFLVSIRRRKGMGHDHHCGGTLLSNEWILTSEHCLTTAGVKPDHLKIGISVYHSYYSWWSWLGLGSDRMTTYNVKDVITHDKYTPISGGGRREYGRMYDLALVQIDPIQDMSGMKLGVPCLPEKEDSFINSPCWVAGWGYVTPDEKVDGKELEYMRMKIISEEQCPSPEDQFGRSMIGLCVAPLKTSSICRGDSGSPLICVKDGQPTLVGVLSGSMIKKNRYWDDELIASYSCGEPGDYGWFASVHKSLDWIKEKTSK